jgi:CelD/BcsL family acetyltransferase involved in cellulose biosynthesis
MGMRQFSVEVADRVEPVTAEWNELAGRLGASPFTRSEWIKSWWSAFGRGALHIFLIRDRGRVVAVLPMSRRRGALRSLTNAHTPAFDLLAEDEETGRFLAAELFASGAHEITISPLDAQGNGLAVLSAGARAAGYRMMVQPALRAPFISGGTNLAAYQRSLSHNLRHDVERRLRRLLEVGAVSVEVCDGSEKLDERLREGFAVEASSWKGAGGTAISSRHSTRSFYSDVAHWAASLGWLRLAFLRLDGRAIAFQFDLQVDRTYYSLKIGFDPAYERFSPGKLLAYTMAARAIALGIDAYELLGTDEPWKYRWTTSVHDRVALLCFRRSATGFLGWSRHVYGRRFAGHVPFARRVAAALRD